MQIGLILRKPWLNFFAWYLGLLAVTPMAALPVDRLQVSWATAARAFFVLFVFVLFVVRAQSRRRVLLAWLSTLATFNLLGLALVEWDRIVLLGLLVAALAVMFEVLRQNLSMIGQLKQPRAVLRKNLTKALVLWLPMLAAAYLGYLAQQWLEDASIDATYALTPINEYCRVGRAKLPCEGLLDDQPQMVRLPLASSIEHHWHELFQSKQVELLARISTTDAAGGVPDEAFTDPLRLAAMLAEINRSASAGSVVGIRADGSQTSAEVLAADAPLKALESRFTDLKTQPPVRYISRPALRSRSINEFIDVEPIEIRTAPQIEALAAQIKRRRDEVLAAAASRLITQQELQGSVARQIGRALFAIERPIDGSGLLAGDLKQVPGSRALLVARVIVKLDREERAVIVEGRRIVAEIDQGLINGSLPKNVPSSLVQVAALGVPAYCTMEKPSPGVYEDDAFTTLATVNKGVFLCSDVTALRHGNMERLDFDSSVDESIAHWRASSEQALEKGTRRGLVEAESKTEFGSGRANDLADAIPAHIKLGRKRCKTAELGSFVNCATNELKEWSEDGYHTAHGRSIRRYRATVEAFKNEAQRSSAELVLFERREMQNQILQAEANMRKSVTFFREAMHITSLLLLALLFVALVKSLLYVIAVVIFDFSGSSMVQVDGTSPIEGESPLTGASDHRIAIDDLGRNELVTKAQLDNQAVRTKFAPWPSRAILARLLRGKYFGYNRGGPYVKGKSVFFSYGDGKHIVDWKLKPGEEVIFHYRNFFGASSNVELRSRVSFKLSTILLGRLVFHSALARTEPGHLLLLTNSIAKPVARDDEVEAGEPERLIAWHPHTGFKVKNELTLRSIVMDPFALVRVTDVSQPGKTLFESPRRSIRLFSGTFRYLKSLLLPF
jgi:hypothetical protein